MTIPISDYNQQKDIAIQKHFTNGKVCKTYTVIREIFIVMNFCTYWTLQK